MFVNAFLIVKKVTSLAFVKDFLKSINLKKGNSFFDMHYFNKDIHLKKEFNSSYYAYNLFNLIYELVSTSRMCLLYQMSLIPYGHDSNCQHNVEEETSALKRYIVN